jgi:glucokinase
MTNKHIALGVDIGGSHITTALVDLNTLLVLPQTLIRKRVNPHGSPQEIISEWTQCIKETKEKLSATIDYIGIAMPGPFDYIRGISKIQGLAKFDSLFGLNVKEMLAEDLGIETGQIRMMNDAGCFLQGEVFSGAAKGYQHVIGLTLGTGLGTARYHEGAADDANLWCMPFKQSIAEDYISTRWFVKRYKELTGKDVKDVKALSELYDTEPLVPEIFREFGINLVAFLEEFIAIDHPQAIVIGGNVANAYPYFKKEMDAQLLKSKNFVCIYLSRLKEEAALIGAASLWAVNTTAKELVND